MQMFSNFNLETSRYSKASIPHNLSLPVWRAQIAPSSTRVNIISAWLVKELSWHINRKPVCHSQPFDIARTRVSGPREKYLITEREVTLSYLISSFISRHSFSHPHNLSCPAWWCFVSWRIDGGLKWQQMFSRLFSSRHLKKSWDFLLRVD